MTFIQRRPNVFDIGPTLYKCYTNILRLLESIPFPMSHRTVPQSLNTLSTEGIHTDTSPLVMAWAGMAGAPDTSLQSL